MDSMLNKRTICYNFRSLQQFQIEAERSVFYGIEIISYEVIQFWKLLLEDVPNMKTCAIDNTSVFGVWKPLLTNSRHIAINYINVYAISIADHVRFPHFNLLSISIIIVTIIFIIINWYY